jgi:hypothetical protein
MLSGQKHRRSRLLSLEKQLLSHWNLVIFDTLYNKSLSDDITCQKITAYYSGTFQYPPDRSKTFQGQLEFSVDLNLHDGKFYSKINRFNREYRWGYHFDIWNGTNIVL